MRGCYEENNYMTSSLQDFLSLLCGEYSNQKQALENPPFFAHIFIRYRQIEHLSPGTVLIEQSYAIEPQNPYRLRTVRAEELSPGIIKLWNHSFREPKQFATASLNQNLRKQIKESDLICLDNCHYRVIKHKDGYHGEIEPGSNCIIKRDGKDTYLVSSFHLRGNTLSTLDRGHDPETNKRCWGAIAGEYVFQRISNWENSLVEK